VPASLHGQQEASVLYNNLPGVLMAAEAATRASTRQSDRTADPRWPNMPEPGLGDRPAIREQAPAGWKGDPAREAQVLNAIFPIMRSNKAATLAIFEIIKNQPGY
jgi:type I restriction enzyme R subunit